MRNEETIKHKELSYLYENFLGATIGYGVVVSFIYYTYYALSDPYKLNIWYGLSILIILLRYGTFRYFKRFQPLSLERLDNFYKLYSLYIILSGALLGACALFIMPKMIEYQMILALFIGGLCVGASVSLATRINLFYTYLILSLGPLILHFLQSDFTSAAAISMVLSFFIILMIYIAHSNAKIVHHNFEVTHENTTLVDKLEQNIHELQEINNAKSKFLSMMSHEIRTPLNAIIGFIKILKDNETDTKKLKYIDTVDKSSFLLLNVINDILDISKIDAGKLELESIAFDPHEEFEHLFLLFSQIAKDKEINFISNIQKDLPRFLLGDIHRLKQISSNLLSNAIKFTPEHKNIYLNISYEKEKALLFIEVKDEGIGIKDENITKLTQEYSQASNSITREYGGTGLGLSIVKRLLCLMDSKLHVESTLDVGSSFSCKIKLNEIESSNEDAKHSDILRFRHKHVLVAEDNKTNQMLIELILQEYGLEVSLSDDGLQAQEAFKDKCFDLVLMDINMPRQNGVDTMKAIKVFEANTDTSTPIIALTANAVAGDKERYIADGFDDYLTKPIDNEKLEIILSKYLT